MPFFDFHCHPSFKHLLSADPTLTPWNDIRVKLKIGRLFNRELQIGINQLFNGSFNSQSNLNQMYRGGVNLAGVVLYSLENNIARGILERKIARTGNINMLDPRILQQLSNHDHYYESTKRLMDSLLDNASPPPGLETAPGVNFKFINSLAEYNAGDHKTIHGILILEGIHNFCSDPFSAHAEDDFNNNFEAFRANYNTRVFAVNIPHLQDAPFASHAFGMQFINEQLFYPSGSGFSEWGKRIITKLYSENILIDLKHMSLYGRTQLQAVKDQAGFADMPLICTHAGQTGCHSDHRYKYLLTRPSANGTAWKLKHVKVLSMKGNAAFNSSSINLYDDEILAILHSRGLIGISIDQRILGFPLESVAYDINDQPYDQEYISDGEASWFFRGVTHPGDVMPRQPGDEVMSGDDAITHGQAAFEQHKYYFLNQVMHILSVAKNAGIPVRDAGKRICIGSDFDGLINPLDCCINAEQFDAFKKSLRDLLTSGKSFWKLAAIKRTEIDVDELLDGIFFKNAFGFLKQNFM